MAREDWSDSLVYTASCWFKIILLQMIYTLKKKKDFKKNITNTYHNFNMTDWST